MKINIKFLFINLPNHIAYNAHRRSYMTELMTSFKKRQFLRFIIFFFSYSETSLSCIWIILSNYENKKNEYKWKSANIKYIKAKYLYVGFINLLINWLFIFYWPIRSWWIMWWCCGIYIANGENKLIKLIYYFKIDFFDNILHSLSSLSFLIFN